MDKKSTFRILAEAIMFDKLKNVKLPTSRINNRRMTVGEIREHVIDMIKEAKKKTKENKEKVQEPEKGWGDAEIANYIEWMKALKLNEVLSFNNKKGK